MKITNRKDLPSVGPFAKYFRKLKDFDAIKTPQNQ